MPTGPSLASAGPWTVAVLLAPDGDGNRRLMRTLIANSIDLRQARTFGGPMKA